MSQIKVTKLVFALLLSAVCSGVIAAILVPVYDHGIFEDYIVGFLPLFILNFLLWIFLGLVILILKLRKITGMIVGALLSLLTFYLYHGYDIGEYGVLQLFIGAISGLITASIGQKKYYWK